MKIRVFPINKMQVRAKNFIPAGSLLEGDEIQWKQSSSPTLRVTI